MAITAIADILEPDVWQSYFRLRSTETSRLIQSGLAATDSQLQALVNGPGTLFNLPFFNDLANTEANISADGTSGSATPLNVTTSKDVAIKHLRNQVWGSADILPSILGREDDPMGAIVDYVAGYWRRQDERQLIAILQGVIADNIANDSGDMVNDLGAGVDISADAILDTKVTMGDMGSELVAIALHSLSLNVLKKANLITFIPDSRGEVQFQQFMGMNVIEDDQLPTDGTNYDTYLFGPGAVAYAEGSPKTPVEAQREALAAAGAGTETLSVRREYVMHPRGIKSLDSAAGNSPTNAELALAAEWDRVYDRKLVRLAMLRHEV